MTMLQAADDSYRTDAALDAVAAGLIADMSDRFGHLAGVPILYLLSARTPMLRGSPCFALVTTPYIQGPLKWLVEWCFSRLMPDGETPEFIVIVDGALWPTWTEAERERVLYHELRHVHQVEDIETGVPKLRLDGTPVLKLVPHDAEFFYDEIERYGLAVCGLEEAALAVARGHEQDKLTRRRGLKIA